MNRSLALIAGLIAAAALGSPGCGLHSAPFKFNQDHDQPYYDGVATQIEAPNVANCPDDMAAASAASPELIRPDTQPNYWDLKLEDAMQMTLARSKVLHELGGTVLRFSANSRTIHGPAIADTDPRYGVEAALSEFDAVFSTKADYQRNDRILNNVFVGGNAQHLLLQDTDVINMQISKKAATGTEFDFRNNTTYDHNNSQGNLFPSAWTTNFEAVVRQPLLQGAGVEYNRIAGPNATPGNYNGVLIARINVDVSLADFEAGLRDLSSNVENAYWDLYFAYRNLDAKIVARDNALESWRKTHALFLAGRRGGEAEKEAEAREQYFHYQEEVQNAWSGKLVEGTETNNGSSGGTFRGTSGVRVAERQLRLLIGLPISDGRLIRPADEPPLAKVVFDWDEILPEALSRRAELRRERWLVKRRELELIASRNFLKPTLDSFALYRRNGFGRDLGDVDNPTDFPLDSAWRDVVSGDHNEWEVGLQLSVPLGERKGHAAVRNAQLVLARERAVLEDQERQVVHDLSNALGDVDRAYEVAQTAYNRRMAAHAQVAATKAAYESDKVPLDLYLEAQRRMAEADSQFFAALVEYALAIKNLHFEKGSLLDYNEIYLAEGPWPDKAYNDAAKRQPSRWQPGPMNYVYRQSPIISAGPVPQGVMPSPMPQGVPGEEIQPPPMPDGHGQPPAAGQQGMPPLPPQNGPPLNSLPQNAPRLSEPPIAVARRPALQSTNAPPAPPPVALQPPAIHQPSALPQPATLPHAPAPSQPTFRPLPSVPAPAPQWNASQFSRPQTDLQSPPAQLRPPVSAPATPTVTAAPPQPVPQEDQLRVMLPRSQQPSPAPIRISLPTGGPTAPTTMLPTAMPPTTMAPPAPAIVRPDRSSTVTWPESSFQPLPPVGTTSSIYHPAPQSGRVSPAYYPADAAQRSVPSPLSAPPADPGLTPPTAPIQSLPPPAQFQSLPPTTNFQPLPPPSAIQSLPPISQIESLPPVDPAVQRLPAVRP